MSTSSLWRGAIITELEYISLHHSIEKKETTNLNNSNFCQCSERIPIIVTLFLSTHAEHRRTMPFSEGLDGIPDTKAGRINRSGLYGDLSFRCTQKFQFRPPSWPTDSAHVIVVPKSREWKGGQGTVRVPKLAVTRKVLYSSFLCMLILGLASAYRFRLCRDQK